jgi:hypothetical protein
VEFLPGTRSKTDGGYGDLVFFQICGLPQEHHSVWIWAVPLHLPLHVSAVLPTTTTTTANPSDEEKKALIIRVARELNHPLCLKAGAQDPLEFVHPNANGTGSMTSIWDSGAAAVKTFLPDIEGGTAASSLTYEQQKRFVQDGLAKGWQEHCPGVVTFTIVEGGGSWPNTSKDCAYYSDLSTIAGHNVCQLFDLRGCPASATTTTTTTGTTTTTTTTTGTTS